MSWSIVEHVGMIFQVSKPFEKTEFFWLKTNVVFHNYLNKVALLGVHFCPLQDSRLVEGARVQLGWRLGQARLYESSRAVTQVDGLPPASSFWKIRMHF